MGKNIINKVVANKVFLIVGLLLSLIYFIGASGNIYLFDNSIIYNYGYLISIGYRPFIDFTTPLLPILGLMQSLSYKMFGVTYYSGVYTAFLLLIFEYSLLYIIINRILSKINVSILFAFLATLGSIPFTSNLYYNHIIFSLVTFWFFLVYYDLTRDKKSIFIKQSIFLIISIIFFIKFHFGVVLFCFQIINDILLRGKIDFKIVIKNYLIGAILFFFIGYTTFYFSNHISFFDYFNSFKLITKDISIRQNINLVAISKLLLNVPKDIFSIIEINTFSLALILYSPIFFSKLNIEKLKIEIFLVFEVLLISLIFSFNSFEPLSILIPLQIVILFLFYNFYKKIGMPESSISFIYSFLFLHFLFSTFYIINWNRKSFDELSGKFAFSIFENKRFNFKINQTKSDRINSFFEGASLTQGQIIGFNYIDSIMKKNQLNRVYFGPELEIFNVIYEIKPIKGFPLWVHPDLTVSKSYNLDLSEKFLNDLPDLIFISKSRQEYLFFLKHDNLINNGYKEIESVIPNNFVVCYIREL